MRQRTRTLRKVAQRLDDPNPEFVSLVGNGANQTPFKVVRSATNAEGNDMNTAIAKITFASDKFADEAAVSTYLTQKGYEDFKIAKGENGGYVVVGRAAADLTDVQDVDKGDGVVMSIGTLTEEARKADADNAAALERVEKSAELEPDVVLGEVNASEIVKKWSAWRAELSEGTTLAEVMSAGADGLPPGLQEVVMAFLTALKNAFITKEPATVEKLTAEFGVLLNRMAKTFAAGTVPADETVYRSAVEIAFTGRLPEAGETEVKLTDAITTETVDKSAEAPAAPAPEVSQEEVAKATEGLIDSKLTAAMAPITEALSGLAAKLGEIGETVSKTAETSQTGLAELREQVTKATERVETLEAVRQSRKSADASGENASTSADNETSKTLVSKAARNLLGFMGSSQ